MVSVPRSSNLESSKGCKPYSRGGGVIGIGNE